LTSFYLFLKRLTSFIATLLKATGTIRNTCMLYDLRYSDVHLHA